ncbi:MAG: hypothetical protein K940chlam3_00104 [Chlamydiae bacterium]|nr:hypothetical protein [Chlamydiota bacterium]
MKKFLLLCSIPVLFTSCASFLSGFSIGSMVSAHAANVMPSEREAIIEQAKKETLDELDYCRGEPVRRKTIEI